ncbi:MAG: hypothetical protein M3133_01720, partial [Actinomycetota bacterium]|nr:hypothetical protein [Actinomycetota bacterium]
AQTGGKRHLGLAPREPQLTAFNQPMSARLPPAHAAGRGDLVSTTGIKGAGAAWSTSPTNEVKRQAVAA